MIDVEKLAKVLALADSAAEGEALAAVRTARQLLARAGLSFRDLAEIAGLAAAPARPLSLSPHRPEADIAALRQRLHELEGRNRELQRQLEGQTRETERWRRLARDTVERLWEVGQAGASPEIVAQWRQHLAACLPADEAYRDGRADPPAGD